MCLRNKKIYNIYKLNLYFDLFILTSNTFKFSTKSQISKLISYNFLLIIKNCNFKQRDKLLRFIYIMELFFGFRFFKINVFLKKIIKNNKRFYNNTNTNKNDKKKINVKIQYMFKISYF
jgi:DUF1009 family protein